MRAFLFIFLIFISASFSGCWDYSEFENMSLISALGVDVNEDSHEITMTVQLYSPVWKGGGKSEGMGSSSLTGVVMSASASTVTDALAKIQQINGRILFYGYMSTLVIGEDAAKYIMKDIFELADRTPNLRSTAYVLIASGKAGDTLSVFNTDTNEPSGRDLQNLVNASALLGVAYPVSIQDFKEMLVSDGIEAVAPHVITTISGPMSEEGSSTGVSENTTGSGRILEIKKGYHMIVGLAAFNGDKFEGWLDRKESRGWGWITGEKIKTYENAGIFGDKETKDILVFQVTNSKSKVKAGLNGGKPVINIDVSVKAALRKYISEKGSDYLDYDLVSLIEEKLADSIRFEIETAIKKCQKDLKSDIFGFGYAVFRKYPKEWRTGYKEKWAEIFPDTPVYINVDAKVENTGTNIKRFNVK